MTRFLIIFQLIFLISSCSQHSNNDLTSETKEINGVYEFVEDSGRVAIRNWGKKYWELNIDNNRTKLCYIESDRGLKSFELSVDIVTNNNSIKIVFDSIISTGYAPTNKIYNIKKGDVFMTLNKNEKGFFTYSDFITGTLKNKVQFSKI
jgi:hypothetical protein